MLEGKVTIQLGTDLLQQIRIASCDDNIININQKINGGPMGGKNKQRWITFAGLELELKQGMLKPFKPLPGGVFKVI